VNTHEKAQLLHRVAGWLHSVKTLQRTYELGRDGDDLFTFAGWRWLPCVTSTRLMERAMQMDWDHWDHWALVHDDCRTEQCPACGGCVCLDAAGDDL